VAGIVEPPALLASTVPADSDPELDELMSAVHQSLKACALLDESAAVPCETSLSVLEFVVDEVDSEGELLPHQPLHGLLPVEEVSEG